MSPILNHGQLLERPIPPESLTARQVAVSVLDSVLDAIDPRNIMEGSISLEHGALVTSKTVYNLESFRRVLVVGGGKAAGGMAEGLEKLLEDRIDSGLVVVPHGSSSRYSLHRIEMHEAGHPVPDEASVVGARRILQMVEGLDDDVLVICLFSGGASSLLAMPREGISLADKQDTTRMLLKSGARINELNAVRKHLSSFKGGQLASTCYPASVLSLIISDVVGDDLDVIASGPTSPDPTRFDDAIRVLKKYDLWDRVPRAVTSVLLRGSQGSILETPKEGERGFARVRNVLLGNSRLACSETVKALESRGLKTLMLTAVAQGEARELGQFLGSLAREIVASGNPLIPPCGLIVGGETTVKVIGTGKGGRNQEVALGAAVAIDGLTNVVVACVNTDGVDGPTDAAGAVADGSTIRRSREMGLDASQHLANNDSYNFFFKLGDLIRTGETGTNLNDLAIVVVSEGSIRSQDPTRRF